jgi:hypothetical protein
MKARIFYATLCTNRFEFEAVNVTEALARDTLRQGLVAHAKAYNVVDVDEWLGEVMQDIEVRELNFGAFYRDRQHVKGV